MAQRLTISCIWQEIVTILALSLPMQWRYHRSPARTSPDWLDVRADSDRIKWNGVLEMTKAKARTKVKTHKATKKRFRLSASGKAMHRQSGTSHLATGLTKKRRRNLRGTKAVATCMESTIHAALNGYSN